MVNKYLHIKWHAPSLNYTSIIILKINNQSFSICTIQILKEFILNFYKKQYIQQLFFKYNKNTNLIIKSLKVKITLYKNKWNKQIEG